MKAKYLVFALAAVAVLAAGCNKQSAQNNAPQTTAHSTSTEAMMKDKDLDKMSDDKIIGIFMRDGKLLTIWPGNDLAVLEKDVTLKSGINVTLSGTITKPGGTKITLQNGQVLNLDGSITAASKEMMAMKAMMGAGEGTTVKNEMMTAEDASKKPGSYKDYSAETVTAEQKAGRKVVLYFYAPWCPYCRAADEAFKNNLDKLPAGVTLLKTSYDNETALKQKYGVTYQHTFVQIDASGNVVTKWVSGDVDLLKQNIK